MQIREQDKNVLIEYLSFYQYVEIQRIRCLALIELHNLHLVIINKNIPFLRYNQANANKIY